MKRYDISTYILAGGQSRRMGLDKLFESFGTESLLKKTIATCLKTTKRIKIVAKEKTKFEEIPYQVLLDDPIADGPLAGIITALKDCREGHCFITAADFFDMNPEIIRSLIELYRDEQFLGMIINNQKQPLCGIYNKDCLPALEQAAHNNNYKMTSVLETLNSKYLTVNVSPWRNINFPEDLEVIKRENV